MKCSFCDSGTGSLIAGPKKLFICHKCVKDFDDKMELEVAGDCSFCGIKIGKIKGVFKRYKINAVAIKSDRGLIICNNCVKLMKDIVREEKREHS